MSLNVSFDDVVIEGVDAGGGVTYFYKGSPLTGNIQEFIDGILVGESEYTDGHAGGVQRLYYPSGQIESEYTIRFNRLEGVMTLWDEEGNITSKSHWKNGA